MSQRSAAAVAQNPASQDVKVERLVFNVSPLGDGVWYSMVGYLYYKGSYHNRPLQLCLHGGTYTHGYWDFPTINGHEYSYARYMAEQKHVVLALDLLGSGESGAISGDALTLRAAATSLMQVMQQMRSAGNPTGQPFEKVALVGHSLGGAVVIAAQAMAQASANEVPGLSGADALVTTGLGHEPHPLPIPIDYIIWASQFPYFGFTPEMRASLFYAAPDADPDVIAYDNQTYGSGQVSRGLLYTAMLLAFDVNESLVGEVSGPVLVQLGENDALFPASYAPQEAAYWTKAPGVVVQSLANVGHDFNTHLDNLTGWKAIHDFLDPLLGAK
jgi:pimeloyl-ACP methyl ester carboxylesterase